jgi:hypothetical protein
MLHIFLLFHNQRGVRRVAAALFMSPVVQGIWSKLGG